MTNTYGVTLTLDQGVKRTYKLKELKETDIITCADETKQRVDDNKNRLVERSEINPVLKGQHNSSQKYQDVPSDDKQYAKCIDNGNSSEKKQKRKLKDNQTVRNHLHTGIERRKYQFLRKETGKKRRSKDFQLLLLTTYVFGTSYAQDIPKATIVTRPIIFGEDVKFQCTYKDNRFLPSLSTVWLKGQEKESIIYGISSTKGGKYTSVIYHNDDVYRYLMTIHNVSESDLDIYRCGFNFQEASLTFKMDRDLSFIYIPETRNIVCNISASKLNIWIPRIYPEPNCTVFCNGEVSKLWKMTVRRETELFSILIQINKSECKSGKLKISCSLGSKSFNWSKNVQQCSNENESLTEKEPYAVYIIIIGFVIFLTISLILVVNRYCACKKDRGIRLSNTII